MSDSLSPETLSKKEKKMKSETPESSEKKSKKEKKIKEESSGKKKDKEKKKRKAVELDDSDKSETSSELGDPVNLKAKKKPKVMEVSDDVGGSDEEENPNALSNFRISKPLRDALIYKGIKALFPIQAMTFDMILDGSDLVGRARTGQVCVCFLG